MHIVGCDFHSRYQQIAVLNEETGEVVERRLEHENGEARAFYASLPKPVRVGLEATGYTQWFERLLQELGHELWVGDAAAIRASVVRKQKYDERDALHILLLLTENRFPRIWMPSLSERDLRQLLSIACGWCSGVRAFRISCTRWPWARGCAARKNCGPAADGRNWRACHWILGPPAAAGAAGTLRSAESTDRRVGRRGVAGSARERLRGASDDPSGRGTADLAGLRADHGSGEPLRARQAGGQLLGLNPREDSSGGHRRTGAISKQGSSLLRWLLVEAGQTAARRDPELHRFYQRVKYRRGSQIAKVAVARKLAVRLYWMLRNQSEYAPRKSAAIPVPGSSSSAVMSGSASGR